MIRSFLVTGVLLVLLAGTARADTFEDLKKRFRREKGDAYAARIQTVQAMAAQGTEEAARFLFEVIRDDKDTSIRLNTIHQVAKIPLPLVDEELLRLVRTGDSSLRSTAFHAFVYNREESLPEDLLAEVLAGTDQGMRANALRSLSRRGDERFLPETERFLKDFPFGATSLTSLLVEAKTPEAARILVRLYDDTRRYDRDTVPKVFVDADASVRAVLIEALQSGDRRLQTHGATLAARARVAEAEPALVAAIPGSRPELHAILVEAIGTVGGATTEGRQAILAALAASEPPVRVAGVRAVRRAPLREAIPHLIDLLEAEDPLARAEAAVTLDRITGQQYGDNAALWRRWWAEYGPTFDLDAVEPREDEGVSQALIDLAIERGAAALKKSRDVKPPWSYAGHDTGTTALVVMALHAAGFTRKDRDVKAGVEFLLKSPVPQRTYETGLVAMALEAVGGKKYKRRIGACAKRLKETQLPTGQWGYPTGNGDNSNTQYAVLGLRAAARAGVRVPKRTWARARDHFLRARAAEGGWDYIGKEPTHPSCSMTAAGVCCLLVCLENMKLDKTEAEEIRAVIDEGYRALGRLMKLDKDTLYALYGIERAGILGGRMAMDGKPWYVPGARRLVEEQGRDGFWKGQYDPSVDTAFAILFLKKATIPVAAATR